MNTLRLWIPALLAITFSCLAAETDSLDERWLRASTRADDLRAQGRLQEAEQAYRDLGMELLGHGLRAGAVVQSKAAIVIGEQGRTQEAEAIAREALDLLKREFGAQHEAYALGLSSLASVLCYRGAYGEARSVALEGLRIVEALDEKPRLLYAGLLTTLSHALQREGEGARAIPVAKKLVALLEPNKSGLVLAQAYNALAGAYLEDGTYALALEAAASAKRALDAAGPGAHPIHLAVQSSIIHAYTQSRQFAQANRAIEDALQAARELTPADHPEIGTLLNNAGLSYAAQGRYADAEELLRRAVELSARVLGPQHPDVDIVKENYRYITARLASGKPGRRVNSMLPAQ